VFLTLPNIQNIEAGFAVTYPNIVYMQVKSLVDLYGSIEGTGKITITRYDDEIISGTFYYKLKEFILNRLKTILQNH